MRPLSHSIASSVALTLAAGRAYYLIVTAPSREGEPLKRLLCLALIAVAVAGTRPAVAQPFFGGSGLEGQPVAPAGWPPEDSCSFTQNTDFTIEPGHGIACIGVGSTDTQYLRVFDLDGEHGLSGRICVESLDYGVEVAEGGVGVTFNVYCTEQGLADEHVVDYAGIDRETELDPFLIFSVSITQRDAELEYFNQPLGGCCDADAHDLAIEIASEDCVENGTCILFIPGTDGYGSTKPYYISAPDCGVVDPIAVDLISGLGEPEMLMQVHATCDEGGGVPASGAVGVALLLLLLLVAGPCLAWRRLRA